MRKVLGALLILVTANQLHASGGTQILGPRIKVTTADQTVSTFPLVLQFTNGTVSVVGSTAIVTTGGGGGGGDNFGSHRATQSVDMSSYNLVAVGTIAATGDIISTNTIKGSVISVSSTIFMTYANVPYNAGGTTVPVIQISTGGTPYLVVNRNGHLSIGDPNTLDFPLLVYSTISPNDPTAREYNGVNFRFPFKYASSLPNGNENFSGLKATLDMQGSGSGFANSNYVVVSASFTNDNINIQSGYAAGFDAQMSWPKTSTIGSAIGVNKNMQFPYTAGGSLNTGVFGDKLTINVPAAGGIQSNNMYGYYADITDSGAGVGRHSIYWLYLNSLTSASGNTWGIYENVAGAKNYFAGKVGISTDTPTRAFEVYNASVASVGATAGIYLTSSTNKLVDMPFFSLSVGTATLKGAVDFDTVTIRSRLDIVNSSYFGSSYTLRVGTGSTGVNTYHVAVTTNGAFSLAGGSPTVSSCGTSPNGALVRGNNQVGEISVGGTAALACTLTFAPPFNFTPVCTVSDNNTAVAVAVTSISNSAVTFGFGASLVGGRVYYQCLGNNE